MSAPRSQPQPSPARGAIGWTPLHRNQPWGDGALAELYDLFPFEDDLPFYLDLAAASGGRVLEVACGTGRLAVPLAQAGHRVVGIDSSLAMLARARERLRSSPSEVSERVRLVQCDMRAFELGEVLDAAFVAVRSFAYLLTRDDQRAALQSVARHLRQGATLVLDLHNPTPSWLLEPPGSRRQDLVREVAEKKMIVTRTETVVATDLARQLRTIRSEYEIIAEDGSVKKRLVEWPFRYTYRFEAEHLLERAGFEIEAVYGGYQREAFASGSKTLLLVARKLAG